MWKKKIACMLLLLILCLGGAITAQAQEITTYSDGFFQYHLGEGYVSICKYFGSQEKVNIPSSIAGRPVTIIENDTFDKSSNIKEIYLPDTVTYIEENVFIGMKSLTKIVADTVDVKVSADSGVKIEYLRGEPENSGTGDNGSSENAGGENQEGNGNSGTTGNTGNNNDGTTGTTDNNNGGTTENTGNNNSGTTENTDDNNSENTGNGSNNPDAGEGQQEITDILDGAGNNSNENQGDSSSGAGEHTENITLDDLQPDKDKKPGITIPSKDVTITVNDEQQLVVQNQETGEEQVLDDSKEYTVVEKEDGSVEIVDKDGGKVVVDENGEVLLGGKETVKVENDLSDNKTPEKQNPVEYVLIIAVVAVAGALYAKRKKVTDNTRF